MSKFCFWFHHLPPSSKCSYILTVSLDILGHSKSHFWDCVNGQKESTDWFTTVCNFFFSRMQWSTQVQNSPYNVLEFYSQIWWQCPLLTPLVHGPQNNGMRMCVYVFVCACMHWQNEPEVCSTLAYQFIPYCTSCTHTHASTYHLKTAEPMGQKADIADMVLLTIRYRGQIGGENVSAYSLKITVVQIFVLFFTVLVSVKASWQRGFVLLFFIGILRLFRFHAITF